MTPSSVTTQTPYKLQMWPAHLLATAALGVSIISVAHPAATRQYTWPWAPLLTLVWLAPLIATVGRLTFRKLWLLPNTLLTAGLIILAAVTLLSAALSPFAQHSVLRIWPTLGGVTLFFWLHDWLGESPLLIHTRTQILSRGLAGFGALLAVVSVGGWIWNNGGVRWSARNEFPFGHSIYTAGAMVLVLPWLVSAAVVTKGALRVVWTIAVLTALLALLSTSSRGGALAVGAICTVSATFVVVRAAWSRRTKASVALVALGVLVLAVWSNPRLRELTRDKTWNAASQESNVQRGAMLEAGKDLGLARPLLGWGPGTVPLAYPQLRGSLSGGVDNVLQLHNSPAQLWATLGCGGVIALVLLLVAFARRCYQIVQQTSPSPVTLSAFASILGYGLFVLTDHQLDVPAMNAMLVLGSALLFVGDQTSQSIAVPPAAQWRFGVASLAILALPLYLTGRDVLARYFYDQSLILFDDGRADEAMEYLETAAQRAPYDPYYRHQMAGRLLDQRAHTGETNTQRRLTSAARVQLERSLSAGCFQEFAHFNLGWLALEANESGPAISHFLATVREAPHRSGAYFGLGLALRAAGNEPAAVRAFALEWIDDPISFTAPLWEWPDFAPLRPQVVREADALLAELAVTRPTARYVRELWNWWEFNAPPPTKGFNPESDAFTQTLATIAHGRPVHFSSEPYAWAALLDAWLRSTKALAFAPLTRNDAPFAAALARRRSRHTPPDIRGFLTAGVEGEPDLLLNTRFARNGYGVLALHPDGPVLTNLYVMQQDRLVAAFAAGLFLSKGWLPATELLARLPDTTVAR